MTSSSNFRMAQQQLQARANEINLILIRLRLELDNNPDLKREVSYTTSIKSETRNVRNPSVSMEKIYEYYGPDINTIILLNLCGNKWATKPWTFKDGLLKELTTANRPKVQ